ncbi:MAG: CoA pyrophosphatase, partial [Mobilicoccus sp.]|nr:CoA pyrophosphatase [Mobilicoccus sp.]
SSVEIVAELPPLYMHPTQNAVTPVLAWWARPHPIGVVDDSEVARVVRADIDHLLDPANRFTVCAFETYRGPAFEVDGLFVWGFTASLLDHVFDLAGLTRPWDEDRMRPLPEHLLDAYR